MGPELTGPALLWLGPKLRPAGPAACRGANIPAGKAPLTREAAEIGEEEDHPARAHEKAAGSAICFPPPCVSAGRGAM